MPGSNNVNQSVVSPKKGVKGIFAAIIIAVFLALSVVAGVLLVRQNQNVQEKAGNTMCPAGEACPYARDPNLLLSCHPVDGDGTTTDSTCNETGRIETCGVNWTEYCCPAAGAAWTTDMTACTPSTPTPTPTKSPTPTPTKSPTPTPTKSPTPTPSPTPPPTAYKCNGIRAYDDQWNLITAFSEIKPGDSLFFTVQGSAATGFDMAQFKINGTEYPVARVSKPGVGGEYYQTYRVPAQCAVGAPSIPVSVLARIHHTVAGWSTY